MTTAIILLLDLLNVFLLFRFILGCEFRKTRSSIVIGAGIVVATFVVMLFYIDVLPYNVVWLFSHSICILPMILLKGNRWNLFGLGVAYFAVTMPIIHLADGVMLVLFKSRAFYANSNWYTICAQVITAMFFCLLIRLFYNKRDKIHDAVISINAYIYIIFYCPRYFSIRMDSFGCRRYR